MSEKEASTGYSRLEIPASVNEDGLLITLQSLMPISIDRDGWFINEEDRTALVVIDVINGFCTPGCGPLAPPVKDQIINEMIDNTDRLARKFNNKGLPIIAVRDCHDGPEHPYPDHCQRGTVESEFVPKLSWMNGFNAFGNKRNLIINKSCINAWIGAHNWQTGVNEILSFLRTRKIKTLIVVGICTDICVMQFVQSVLSARNNSTGLLPEFKDVIVYVPGCATYDLPLAVCRQLNLPETAAHPRGLAHHLGLYFMQQSGAILTNHILI